MNTLLSYGTLPADVVKHGETKVFTTDTVPKALTREHSTKDGVWGLICVEAGTLDYEILSDEHQVITLIAGEKAVVLPTILHRVHPGSNAAFKVEFYSPART